jgi:hypothetical protein
MIAKAIGSHYVFGCRSVLSNSKMIAKAIGSHYDVVCRSVLSNI